MMSPHLLRRAGPVAALALALAPAALQAAETTRPNCPDAATVQAARVVEFQTMMMGVAVRCRHVSVPISDHLEEMTTARRTTLASANDRVAAFLRSLPAKGAPAAAPAASPSPPPPAPAKAAMRPAMRHATPRTPAPAVAAPAPGKAAPAEAVRARTPKTPVASGADDWEEF